MGEMEEGVCVLGGGSEREEDEDRDEIPDETIAA